MSDVVVPKLDEALKERAPKYRYGTRIRKINLGLEMRRLKNVLHRETDRLLIRSKTRKLNKDESASLVQYLKLVKDLLKEEKDEEKGMTDEQLAKIAGV